MFTPIEFDYYKSFSQVIECYAKGIQEGQEHKTAIDQYGKCNIELPERGIFKLLIEGVLSPFYIFQMFSCILWYVDDYEIYASCILFTSVISMSIELYELRK